MQIRNTVVEYNLEEAAATLDISPEILKWAVDAEYLQCYYRLGKNDYRFHEASLRANKELLGHADYLTDLLTAFSLSDASTASDAQKADPLSKPSDP